MNTFEERTIIICFVLILILCFLLGFRSSFKKYLYIIDPLIFSTALTIPATLARIEPELKHIKREFYIPSYFNTQLDGNLVKFLIYFIAVIIFNLLLDANIHSISNNNDHDDDNNNFFLSFVTTNLIPLQNFISKKNYNHPWHYNLKISFSNYIKYRLSWTGRIIISFHAVLTKYIDFYLDLLSRNELNTISVILLSLSKYFLLIPLVLLLPISIPSPFMIVSQILCLLLVVILGIKECVMKDITVFSIISWIFDCMFLAPLFMVLFTIMSIFRLLHYFFKFILPFHIIFNMKSIFKNIRRFLPVVIFFIFLMFCLYLFINFNNGYMLVFILWFVLFAFICCIYEFTIV